jgi:hypothetical protein
MTSTSSPRSSPPRCSRAAPRFHERETFSLVPARLVPVSPRTVRASSSSSIDPRSRARMDGSRVVVALVVVARSSSSLASRSRAHLDDDERSPELIERETHRARPIVAISRARATSSIRRHRDVGARTTVSSTSSTIHQRYYVYTHRIRTLKQAKVMWGTISVIKHSEVLCISSR